MSLLRELQANDPNDFRNHLRMDEDTFKDLFNLVGPHSIVFFIFQQILTELMRSYPLTRQ
nr:unnamed protein product [Callosobruchus chinensis]